METLFWLFAVLASVFYGVFAFDVFHAKRPGKKEWQQWAHQIWLNFSGAAIGWATLYYLLVMRLRVFGKAPVTEPGGVDILLLLVAILGITGHLPYTVVGIARGISDAVRKALEKVAG